MATTPDKKPTLGEKILESAPGVSALVVAISFAFGSAQLFGKTFALGVSASDFLSVSDLATATVRHSPFAIIILVAMVLLELVLPSARKSAQDEFPRAHYGIFFLTLIAAMVFFWTVRPSLAAHWILLLSFPLSFSFLKITNFKVDQDVVPPWTGLLALLMVFVGLGFLSSYSDTIRDVTAMGNRAPKAKHSICFEDRCRPGLLVVRFAETSVIRWVPEEGLDYIPNNQIARISIAEPVADRPIFNVWGTIAAGWSWLLARAGGQ
ncbi:hypothetical protein [Mesorhizobium xinjiangense]|uniref:hypothetical protein n=1 Tax=Mesorhizobium xinjiangense TaxID=2678685 RepID=UPI0012ED1273|nr:hypothetical protein [Mesorhizobium xinjiangense]